MKGGEELPADPLSCDDWTVAIFAVLQSAASVTVGAAVYAMESCWVASV